MHQISEKQSGYISQLDGIRAVAIGLVIIAHFLHSRSGTLGKNRGNCLLFFEWLFDHWNFIEKPLNSLKRNFDYKKGIEL